MGFIEFLAYLAIVAGFNLFVYIANRYMDFVYETFGRKAISHKVKKWIHVVVSVVAIAIIALIIIAEKMHQ